MPSSLFGSIRVKKTPDGEAPEWVRKGWIGVELLCLFYTDESPAYGDVAPFGVLSGQPAAPRGKVYIVPQEQAITALMNSSPNAACWWEDHGFPRGDGSMFSFGADEADEVNPVLSRQEVDDTLRVMTLGD